MGGMTLVSRAGQNFVQGRRPSPGSPPVAQQPKELARNNMVNLAEGILAQGPLPRGTSGWRHRIARRASMLEKYVSDEQRSPGSKAPGPPSWPYYSLTAFNERIFLNWYNFIYADLPTEGRVPCR